MTSAWSGFGGAGPEGGNPRHEVLLSAKQHIEWCRRRALWFLNQNEIGCVGNALGGLVADLSRYKGMEDMIEKVKALPPNREAVLQFVEYM